MEMWQKETAETKLNSMLFSDIAVTQADTGTAERRGRCVYTVLGQLRSEVSLGLCRLSWPRTWLLPSTPRLLALRWSRVDQTTGVIQAGPNYLQDAVNLNALLAWFMDRLQPCNPPGPPAAPTPLEQAPSFQMTQREGYTEGKFALGGLALCQVEKTVEVGIFFSLTCLTFTVVAKRSSIEDLVLMRTKLLKWSSFGPPFT